MEYCFDEILDRTRERSKTWDFRTLKPGQLPMNGAETHFACPVPVKEAVRAVAAWEVYGYPYFTEDFSNAAAGYMKRRHGWDCDPSWVEFVGGIVPGIAFAIQAVSQPGDKVLINTPAYDPFRSMIEANERVVEESPLLISRERVEFDWEDMEARFRDPRTKAFILCDPHNPTGKNCTYQELRKIADLAERYGVLVIVDEVHADFVFHGAHISYPTVSESALQNSVVVINPSKTFNVAGFRTGAVIVPNEALREKINVKILAVKGISRTITGVAAFEACYDGRCDDYADQVCAYVAENEKLLASFLEEHIPSIHLIRPDACFICWLDCRDLGFPDQKSLMDFFTSAGVLVTSGEEFDHNGRGAGFVRMAYAFPRSQLLQALERLAEAAKRIGKGV